jgi:hypothetical protein
MSAEGRGVRQPEVPARTGHQDRHQQQAADKFDGKYFVVGTTHRYSHGTLDRNPTAAYTTVFRLAR